MIPQPDYITACVAGLEIAIFGANENEGAPVIFCTHGRGGAIESMYDWCRDLRTDGFIAIGLNQRNHGRRMVDPRCNGGWDAHHAADMYGVMLGTAFDMVTLLDMIPARLGINLDKVGMTGSSLGGHATLMAMALDKRIDVGVPLIGSGDYRRLMELRASANGVLPEEFEQYYPLSLRDTVLHRDPINNPAIFADRPLLMCNGEDDKLVQIECNHRFFRVTQPHYEHHDRIKLSAYPSVGHEVPPKMWTEARDWFKKWLVNH